MKKQIIKYQFTHFLRSTLLPVMFYGLLIWFILVGFFGLTIIEWGLSAELDLTPAEWQIIKSYINSQLWLVALLLGTVIHFLKNGTIIYMFKRK